MTKDTWVAVLQVLVVVITAVSGLGGVAGSALEPWLKVAVVAIGAVLTYVFGIVQPIAKAQGLKK